MPVERTPTKRGGRTRRPAVRTVALIAISAALSTLPALPPGAADELKDRERRVERKIEDSEDDLRHSSAELAGAARRLTAAQEALGQARDRLGKAQRALSAAEALDRRLQVALEASLAALAQARAELEQGRADLAASEDEVRGVAVQLQAAGGTELLALSAVFTSKEPAQLSEQLSSQRSVVDTEAAVSARLDASRVLLTVQERAQQEATDAVAARREAAARNLELTWDLKVHAQQARDSVVALVAERRAARQQASAATAQDLRELRQYRAERSRISTLLKRRAARARARAAAARGQAAAAAPGLLSFPVDDGYVTSSYGVRFHPILRQWRLHDGTDFGAGCGAPIRAAAGGRVVGRYYNSAYGNRVIIDHGWVAGAGLATSYNHLSGYATSLGQRVRRGDVIGFMGDTGYSTGCHLHFMVFRNGGTADPMRWL